MQGDRFISGNNLFLQRLSIIRGITKEEGLKRRWPQISWEILLSFLWEPRKLGRAIERILTGNDNSITGDISEELFGVIEHSPIGIETQWVDRSLLAGLQITIALVRRRVRWETGETRGILKVT